MKKILIILLYITTTTAFVIGLIFYQYKKDNPSLNNQTENKKANSQIDEPKTSAINPIIKNTISPKNPANNSAITNIQEPVINSPVVTQPVLENITLNTTEISKHNKSSDCWLLISGKIYNITSFFGSHPGGNGVMAATCGTDATAAYNTKDPNATSSNGRSSHSSNASNMLNAYFIGNLNQTIGQQKILEANTVVSPVINGDDKNEDD